MILNVIRKLPPKIRIHAVLIPLLSADAVKRVNQKPSAPASIPNFRQKQNGS